MHYVLGFSLGESLYRRDWLSLGLTAAVVLAVGAVAPVRAVA